MGSCGDGDRERCPRWRTSTHRQTAHDIFLASRGDSLLNVVVAAEKQRVVKSCASL